IHYILQQTPSKKFYRLLYSASNRGDAAILEGVYQSLEDVYPDANITVMTESPRAAELVNGIDAEKQVLAGFQWDISKKNVARAYLSMASHFYTRGMTPPGFEYIKESSNIQPYLDADLVISTGGQFLTDIYFPEKIGILWEHYFLNQIETPVIIYAQTLGPFNRSPYRTMVKTVLDKTDLIITRDKESKRIIEDLGISTPVHFTADAAFSINIDNCKKTPLDPFRKSETLPDIGERTVSISVREWKHTDADTAVDDYALVIANIADWLIEEKNVNVVFASTCTGLDRYKKDDRLMAAQIVNLMEHGEQEKVQILSSEYTPQQLVHIYKQMDLHIGMRMHSNILAMMAKTPVVAIQYQFKTKGLMGMFDLLDYMIDINDVDEDSLQQIVEDAFNQRAQIVDTLQSKLPTIQSESRRSARLVKEYFNSNKHNS
ncbi:polysaccharide pyruvyl transferase family protein, partial [Natronoglomus mannanivorans]|nr:polysaccharide pyruvyl transferase family protein [Halobacteria archaeon AArc-xg1-1]